MTVVPDSALGQSLGTAYAATWSSDVESLLFRPEPHDAGPSLRDGFRVMQDHGVGVEDSLLPLAIVDEASIACVALAPRGAINVGDVVRLHLDASAAEHQLRLLDVNALAYVSSLNEELAARSAGISRILDVIGPAYRETFIDHERRPRDFVLRPVRLACQNVIVGLAAIAQDSTFDGLSVVAWQTAEVPHVVTHEGNRALAALMLCDAFARGGTMEIRFDRPATTTYRGRTHTFPGHAEGQVPASLRRYGRTVGVYLGADDPGAITPAEARALFLAVTLMSPGLRRRVERVAASDGFTPERACYALLSQVWREIELDLLLSTSMHASSILGGGAVWTHRSQRQAESDACRAALMAGMYYRRLNGRDSAGSTDGPRVVEDVATGVSWRTDPELAAVTFQLPGMTSIPWSDASRPLQDCKELTVVPRTHVTQADINRIEARLVAGVPVALLVPHDWAGCGELPDIPLLRCPDRLADLDRVVEEKLLTLRISRA